MELVAPKGEQPAEAVAWWLADTLGDGKEVRLHLVDDSIADFETFVYRVPDAPAPLNVQRLFGRDHEIEGLRPPPSFADNAFNTIAVRADFKVEEGELELRELLSLLTSGHVLLEMEASERAGISQPRVWEPADSVMTARGIGEY